MPRARPAPPDAERRGGYGWATLGDVHTQISHMHTCTLTEGVSEGLAVSRSHGGISKPQIKDMEQVDVAPREGGASEVTPDPPPGDDAASPWGVRPPPPHAATCFY